MRVSGSPADTLVVGQRTFRGRRAGFAFSLVVSLAAVFPAFAQPVTVPIDPRETYLVTQNDPSAVSPGHAISLAALSIKPGDQIRLSVFGLVNYCAPQSCFMSDPGGFAAFTDGRVPRDGALLTNLSPYITPPAGCGQVSTDLANDFLLPGFMPITVTVPPGATTLWAAYGDCFYSDNAGTFNISIEKIAGLAARLDVGVARIPPAGTSGSGSVLVDVRCESPGTPYAWPFVIGLSRAGSANGAHDDATHSGPRPLGALFTDLDGTGQRTVSGTTVPGQPTLLFFRPSDVAGGVDVTLTCGTGQATTVRRIDVRVGVNLVPLDSALSRIETGNSHGLSGDHLAKAVRDDYLQAVSDFRRGPPYLGPWPAAGKVVQTSGMSLPWGGRYDTDRDWVAPHKAHREGTSIDIRHKLLTPFERSWLAVLLRSSKFKMIVADERPEDPLSSHWHAEWAGSGSASQGSARAGAAVCDPSSAVQVSVTPAVSQRGSE